MYATHMAGHQNAIVIIMSLLAKVVRKFGTALIVVRYMISLS